MQQNIQEAKEIISTLSVEQIAQTCLVGMTMPGGKNEIPSILRDKMRENLCKALEKPSQGIAPSTHLLAVLEDLITLASRTIVSLAGMDIESIVKDLGVPEDKRLLIRRAIEDILLEVFVSSLKGRIRNAHVELTSFLRKTEG